ncbi:MAG: DUF4129 domain-containing protein [Thermoplasmata archaeon]|nr:DUF4129 domain-containing protein [Thermoplasmata archaeon]
MATGPPPRPRASPLALVFILAAVLIGVAAALLSGPPAPSPSFLSEPGFTVGYSALQVFSGVVIALVVIWIVYRVVQRIRDPSGAQSMGRSMVVFLVMFLLFLGFIAISHLIAYPPANTPASGPNGNGMMGPPPHPVPPMGAPLGNLTFGSWSVPGWTGYVVVLGIAVVVVLVAIPLAVALRPRNSGPRVVPAPTIAERTRAEIADTLEQLESDPNADPRAVIVALYARLLVAIDPKIENAEARTARELESLSVERLALPPAAARELTALFEEARYSVHAMTRDDGVRARAALQRILAALDVGRPT